MLGTGHFKYSPAFPSQQTGEIGIIILILHMRKLSTYYVLGAGPGAGVGISYYA